LVVEWLEEVVGCFCEETMKLDSRANNGSCERTAQFGAEENVAESLELHGERGEKLRGKKIRERGGKIEREEKNLSVDLLRGVCRVVPVNGWFKFSLLKYGVITLSSSFP
jgi:hypothetical protein